MSRLIYADEAKELIAGIDSCFAEFVDNIPTAYDVEAVVRELEEKRVIAFLTLANSGNEALDKAWEYVGTYLDEVIEIVRGGRNE
jgi:hypothetical protein